MADYPNSIPTFTTLTDNVDDVLASHQNVPNGEINAIATELGTNPKTITDATSPAASPSSVAQYLDMVATAIKTITGAANWYTVAAAVMKSIGTTKGDLIVFTGSGTPVRQAIGTNNQVLTADSAQTNGLKWESIASAVYSPGHLKGLTLSNNGTDPTNDIDIAVGTAIDSTDAVNIVLAGALTKRLDAAWAVGTNQGGLDTGSIANTTYHIWLIKRSDTGVVDALFSTSASAPTMPASYNYKRRIGSIMRVGGAIVTFVQTGDYFRRKASILDIDVSNPGTGAVTRTLSVPTGIKIKALMNLRLECGAGTGTNCLLSDLDANDEAPSGTAAPLGNLNVPASGFQNIVIEIMTNTSAQIRSRNNASDANTLLRIATLGWEDTRGRLA